MINTPIIILINKFFNLIFPTNSQSRIYLYYNNLNSNTNIKMTIKISYALIFIIALIIPFSQADYCSAYCSYFWNGASYVPQCTDYQATSCLKCDTTLFLLSGTSCVSHGLYNETLFIQDLNPATTATGWATTGANAYPTTIFGLYNVYYFDQTDRLYKDFTLPAHFAVRVRFFALRSSGAAFRFQYFINNQVYGYSYNNFPSSNTLGDIITTDLIPHDDSTLSIAFQGDSFALGQFIGIKQLLVFVSKCSTGCTMCSSASNCVSCGMVGAVQSYLYQKVCYTQCPQTTYPEPTTLKCQSCDPQCYNCNTNPTFCTQCVFQGMYQSFLYINTCYYTCPFAYYPNYDTNVCQCPSTYHYINTTTSFCTSCSIQCEVCFGSLRTQCTSCVSGFYLVSGTTWCSNTCPSNQYANPFNNKCYPCVSNCSSCQNTSTTCTGCFFVAMKYLYNHTCVLACPGGYEPNNITRMCDACPPYYYSFNETCSVQCPTYYMATNQTKTCIHLSQTNFTYAIKITNVQILFGGRSMQISVNFGYGLSAASIDWLLRQSYFDVTIQIGDQASLKTARLLQTIKATLKQDDLTTQRMLLASTYSVRGVSMSSNTFIFTAMVPVQFSYNLNFMINFGLRLKNPSNISYSNTTLFYSIAQDPQLLRQFYLYSQKYFYNIALIPLIFIGVMLLFIKIKGSYQLLMEYFRMMQLIGLSVLATYPFKSQVYYLLDGFNYFNLQFFPNIYNWFVTPFSDAWAIEGFVFYYGDMDFIRLMGSILIFIVVCIFTLIVMKTLIKASPQNMGWTLKFFMDLAEIKILHSFWSSLVFTFGNTDSTNLVMYLVHIVSYFFMGFLIYRQLKLYQSTQQINWLFFWRLIATLLLVITSFSKLVLFVILFIISIAAATAFYLRWPVNECKQYKFGFVIDLKNAVITSFPIFAIFISGLVIFYQGQLTEQLLIIFVLLLVYLIMAVIVFVIICLNYLHKEKQRMIQSLSAAKSKALKNEYYEQLNKSNMSADIYFNEKQLQNDLQNLSNMGRRTEMRRTTDVRETTQGNIIEDQPIQKKFKTANISHRLVESQVMQKQLDEVGQIQVKNFNE